jgi:hypothetical protein
MGNYEYDTNMIKKPTSIGELSNHTNKKPRTNFNHK